MQINKQNNTLMYGAGFGLALLFLFNQDKKHINTPVHQSTKEFIKKMYPIALSVQKITKVPYLVILTFAAVESGWGKHAVGNNYFGIKANKNWKGEISRLKTPECMRTGNAHINAEVISIEPAGSSKGFKACNNKGDFTYWINDKFRKYSSPEASFLDYGLFIDKYYKNAFKFSDPEQFGSYVLTHGYSTAQYVATFIDLMRRIKAVTDQ